MAQTLLKSVDGMRTRRTGKKRGGPQFSIFLYYIPQIPLCQIENKTESG
jgi:hypothetical protein